MIANGLEGSYSDNCVVYLVIHKFNGQYSAMSIDTVRQFIKEKAEQFGAKTDNEFNKPYIERLYTVCQSRV